MVVVVEVDLVVVVDLLVVVVVVVVVVVEVVVEALAVVDVDTKSEVLPFNVPLSIIVELNSGGDEGDAWDLNVSLLQFSQKNMTNDLKKRKRKQPIGSNSILKLIK